MITLNEIERPICQVCGKTMTSNGRLHARWIFKCKRCKQYASVQIREKDMRPKGYKIPSTRMRPPREEMEVLAAKYSAVEMADVLWCSSAAVRKWLRHYGIEAKPTVHPNRKKPTKTEWAALCLEYTVAEIAKLRDVSPKTVREWARDYNRSPLFSRERIMTKEMLIAAKPWGRAKGDRAINGYRWTLNREQRAGVR
jgi:hypothetical protein